MLDFIWNWLPWIGGASTLALIVVAIAAPSVLQVAAAWLTALSPLLKGIAEGIVELAKALWAGLLDMVDNGKSILFVVIVACSAFLYGRFTAPKEAVVEVDRPCIVTTPSRNPTRVTDPVSDFFKNLGLPF